MIAGPSNPNRRVVPRWRSLRLTLEAGELATPKALGGQLSSIPDELLHRLEAWRMRRSLIQACELADAAIVHGLDHEGIDAARFLTWKETKATPAIRAQAAELLRRVGFSPDIPKDLIRTYDDGLAHWRKRVHLHPADAVSWTELARHQAISGQSERAERSLRAALQLAPNNRHVLRSAARFFLHQHDAQKAHNLIRKNEATPHDPWLLAAEISLASVAKRSPMFSKRAAEVLGHARTARQITELAGAMGTLELLDGSRKHGKRLFEQSLADPTGNSLAQVEWAAFHLKDMLPDVERLSTKSDSKEALTQRLCRTGDFDNALVAATAWISDEPVSGAAYQAATHCSAVLDRYEDAERFARLAMRHSPNSSHHRLSLVFALACQDRVDDAEAELRKLTPTDDHQKGVIEADHGLIAMRRGDVDLGVQRYKASIGIFRRAGLKESEAIATAYFAKEAVRVKHEIGLELLKEITANNAKSPHAQITRIAQSVEQALAAR